MSHKRKPTVGSRSGEAGPPQSHRERTEDPRRARPKGGGAKDQKGPKGQRKARPRAGRKDPRAAKEGGGRGGSARPIAYGFHHRPLAQGRGRTNQIAPLVKQHKRTKQNGRPDIIKVTNQVDTRASQNPNTKRQNKTDNRTKHHFGHQSGRDERKQSPNTNRNKLVKKQNTKINISWVCRQAVHAVTQGF